MTSPFDPNSSNDGGGLFNVNQWTDSFANWTDYLVWAFIFLFIAIFVYNAVRAIYGLVIKNGDIQKRSIYGATVSLILLLVLRLGFILVFAIAAYGLNRFLLDMVHFISGNALYLSAGVFFLSIFFFFIHQLINHPGIKRRASHFLVGSIILIAVSFIVPMVFLDV